MGERHRQYVKCGPGFLVLTQESAMAIRLGLVVEDSPEELELGLVEYGDHCIDDHNGPGYRAHVWPMGSELPGGVSVTVETDPSERRQ